VSDFENPFIPLAIIAFLVIAIGICLILLADARKPRVVIHISDSARNDLEVTHGSSMEGDGEGY
jgi:hypothetical protein